MAPRGRHFRLNPTFSLSETFQGAFSSALILGRSNRGSRRAWRLIVVAGQNANPEGPSGVATRQRSSRKWTPVQPRGRRASDSDTRPGQPQEAARGGRGPGGRLRGGQLERAQPGDRRTRVPDLDPDSDKTRHVTGLPGMDMARHRRTADPSRVCMI